MISACPWSRLVFFASFFQIDTFGSSPVAFLPSVIILSHKALWCVPNVLIVLLTCLLCFCLVCVEADFTQGSREPFRDVLTQLHCHPSIA